MKKIRVGVGLGRVLCFLLTLIQVRAADWFVATNGTATGSGTLSQPYDLVTALSGSVGQPGDTFWLRDGTYTLGHVVTSLCGAAGQPITFRQMPGEQARIDGALTIWNQTGTPGYLIFRDLELFNSNPQRVSSETNVGFNPTDIQIIPGIQSYEANCSFINLVIHDQTRHGIYVAQASDGDLIYGCVIYNNGWRSPDNAEGHAIYAQGSSGSREIADNLLFNCAGAGSHVYDADGTPLVGFTIEGNVAFNAGAIQNVRAYRDWVVGTDSPSPDADGIIFNANMGYLPSGSTAYTQLEIGRQGTNGSLTLTDNYMPLGLLMSNWTTASVTGNVFAPQNSAPAVDLEQTLTTLSANWDANSYWIPSGSNDFLLNSTPYTFAGWQSATGFDTDSTDIPGSLQGVEVFIRPNRFTTGRANIAIYNWTGYTNVAVDVSSVLAQGMVYEVRNAEDYFAPPVLSGIYYGQPLQLPMAGLTVAAPLGGMLTPPPTGPTFNVFVLLPLPSTSIVLDSVNSGVISYPFIADDGAVYQTDYTPDPAQGGEAIYNFTLSEPGNFVVSAMVNAPDSDSNSFFLDIDAEPTNPEMIWDIPVTCGFENRTVSWRGSGTEDANQFDPMVFTLSAGTHQLIVRGCEANCQLGTITVSAASRATAAQALALLPLRH